MPAALDGAENGIERCENRQHRGERRIRAQFADQRDRRQGGPKQPDIREGGGQRRAEHEEGERHHHSQRAAAHGEQGAGTAAAAELHADPEHERAEHQGQPDREDETGQRPPAQLAKAKEREEGEARHRQHRDLRADAGALPLQEEAPPGRGEAEARVVERQPGKEPDRDHRRATGAELPECDRTDGQGDADRRNGPWREGGKGQGRIAHGKPVDSGIGSGVVFYSEQTFVTTKLLRDPNTLRSRSVDPFKPLCVHAPALFRGKIDSRSGTCGRPCEE